MNHSYTPLRYPGGKAKFGPYLSAILKGNRLFDGSYAEPYAGGAGAAFFLLFRGYVSRVHLNDIDKGVTSFWRAVLNNNEKFAKAIENVPLSIKEWDSQKEIYRSRHGGFDLGFAFFYLNRTNRSGIMNGGIIGGRRQESAWGIDARFNKVALAERIRSIGRIRRQISISNDDALEFVDGISSSPTSRSIIYLDPPYFAKGKALYTNYYTAEDHGLIAARLKNLTVPWVLTYDDCREIRSLYSEFRIRESELSYSARDVRRGSELVVFSQGLKIPRLSPATVKRHGTGFTLIERHK